MGCSEPDSAEPAALMTSAVVAPAPAVTAATAIRASVTVPVLSNTMVSICRADSSTSGPLITMPSWAPRPVPTSKAVGVASPSAHGHAMINTATADVNANDRPEPWPSQKPRVATASAMTMGTNTAETRSASCCTAALPLCAASTIRAICASCVSAPTRVASTTSLPWVLTVAPTTASPGPTSTGTDSPVTVEASRALCPETITPSVATRSPGRTTNVSPTCSWEISTTVSPLAVRMMSSDGASSSNARTAAPDRRLARDSRQRPSRRNARVRPPGPPHQQPDPRPAETRQRADGDQCVHGRVAVLQVQQGGPVERPRTPDDYYARKRERDPLPPGKLPGGNQ